MAEYTRTTRRATTLLDLIRRTPATRLRIPLVELGRYPLGLLIGGALVFDHHTHLRHDMAPALGRPAPATGADRMRAALTWMLAVLSNQIGQAPVAGLDARVALTLTGPGGGTWWIDEAGVLGGFVWIIQRADEDTHNVQAGQSDSCKSSRSGLRSRATG
ncbi:hypothetical protein UK15_36860 [Streptomyces variegatus]|uniref:Uncharacterized protein n=1 Tax=Streptomyces variegatus TaxID=284040 RepID=A0A0M2GBU6_9ACTN|nr:MULTISPECIES: hypothetical protein [Streptomyces]KJK34263.1 hypothetical protein UK15_36860 [Streptomyces variegatus]